MKSGILYPRSVNLAWTSNKQTQIYPTKHVCIQTKFRFYNYNILYITYCSAIIASGWFVTYPRRQVLVRCMIISQPWPHSSLNKLLEISFFNGISILRIRLPLLLVSGRFLFDLDSQSRPSKIGGIPRRNPYNVKGMQNRAKWKLQIQTLLPADSTYKMAACLEY